jgi:hypothetical protein
MRAGYSATRSSCRLTLAGVTPSSEAIQAFAMLACILMM